MSNCASSASRQYLDGCCHGTLPFISIQSDSSLKTIPLSFGSFCNIIVRFCIVFSISPRLFIDSLCCHITSSSSEIAENSSCAAVSLSVSVCALTLSSFIAKSIIALKDGDFSLSVSSLSRYENLCIRTRSNALHSLPQAGSVA